MAISHESNQVDRKAWSIDRVKPFWVLIILGFIILGYIAYPKIYPEPLDTIPTTGETVTDIDGNVYRTIKIGDQTWMMENLKTTRLNDGQEIPYVTVDREWETRTSPGYCWPNNDPSNKDDYGAMYNWHTVDTGKLAPEGWHVPTYEEWETLAEYLEGDSVAGGALKEMNFSIRWAGDRIYTGEFVYFNEFEKYWCSTGGGWHPTDAQYWTITRQETVFSASSHPRMDGHSVRCIKDN
ncbi:fibrobacter succinogenes major paralogous domain-containing protein [Candidatus Bathyarchaeota archaeon]|nr:fibrobacter succinogenes major paralogous domain-containing protein [Candidatus Bathyarchaeota archaeon]